RGSYIQLALTASQLLSKFSPIRRPFASRTGEPELPPVVSRLVIRLTVWVPSAGSAVLPKPPLVLASRGGAGAANGAPPACSSTTPCTVVSGASGPPARGASERAWPERTRRVELASG